MDIKNLAGIEEVYELTKKARSAFQKLSLYSQEEADHIVDTMARDGLESAEYLARLAAGETGMGRVESKIAKNRFSVTEIHQYIRPMKTAGIIGYNEKTGIYEIAEPVGVIAAVIPTTNPTSTAMFKALISMKARNCVVFAPHPKAVRCTSEAVRIMREAAISAGAPDGCLECLTQVSLEATQELMKCPDVSLILATGGPGLVEAAYKSGKPAIGVGQGNTPVYIDRSASIPHAVRCIVESQTFDFGTICSSEQAIVVDEPIKKQVVAEFQKQKAYFLTPDEVKKVSDVAMKDHRMNPDIVGQPAYRVAQMSGVNVPVETTVLLAPLEGVGPDYPLSGEKLCPLLGFYTARGWEDACQRCMELLEYEGAGHTLGIHATNPDIIMEFGLQKPVSRIIVNAPTSQGGVGLATNLVPSLTLGCGAPGNNITSDNISSRHLFNIKRVAAIRPDFPLWGTDRAIASDLSKIKLTEKGLAEKAMDMEIKPLTPVSKPSQPKEMQKPFTPESKKSEIPDHTKSTTATPSPVSSPALSVSSEKSKSNPWEVRTYPPPRPDTGKRIINWP